MRFRTRIDKCGYPAKCAESSCTGRILVEMPGIKDIDRVKKMLATSAKLQFWEVQVGQEALPSELSQLVKQKEILSVLLKLLISSTFFRLVLHLEMHCECKAC